MTMQQFPVYTGSTWQCVSCRGVLAHGDPVAVEDGGAGRVFCAGEDGTSQCADGIRARHLWPGEVLRVTLYRMPPKRCS